MQITDSTLAELQSIVPEEQNPEHILFCKHGIPILWQICGVLLHV